MNPFDVLNAINDNKVIPIDEKSYPSFMVNRGLSNFVDTVLYANEMNRYHHLDSQMQFDFLVNIVRKKKRFSKWNKAQKSDDIDTIKEYFGYSTDKARDILPLLSSEQIKEIKQKISKGGKG